MQQVAAAVCNGWLARRCAQRIIGRHCKDWTADNGDGTETRTKDLLAGPEDEVGDAAPHLDLIGVHREVAAVGDLGELDSLVG